MINLYKPTVPGKISENDGTYNWDLTIKWDTMG
jgi:hypothetical protein